MEGLEKSARDIFYQKGSTKTGYSSLLIYRKLGPRLCIHATNPEWSCPDQDLGTGEASAVVAKGCLWQDTEEANKNSSGGGIQDNDAIGSSEETDDKNRRYRLRSPPYLNLDEEFPGANLLAKLSSKAAIQIFTEDALSIPQWTPWPEEAHYKVSSLGNDKPWTVFPLCHCFPANKPENLTWIPSTKSFVPRTCQLLEELLSCGDGQFYLRTALFSQMSPRSVLEEHTGWADLANHVLRMHIPLIVPNDSDANGENDDLCGTWVDGCVETHAVGRPIVFDDSKYHRAFNYSDRDRIILIVDLARPERLPLGSAKAGYTDELQAYIKKLAEPH